MVLVVTAFPVIAIVALVKTININDRLRGIETRLAVLEPQVAGAPGAAPVPPAPASTFKPAPEPIVPPAASAVPPPPPKPAPVRPKPAVQPTRPAATTQPEHVISFEERFGTRW